MSPAFLLLGVALLLQPSLAIDDGSACRYLTHLLEDLPRRIPTTTFKSNQGVLLNDGTVCVRSLAYVSIPVSMALVYWRRVLLEVYYFYLGVSNLVGFAVEAGGAACVTSFVLTPSSVRVWCKVR